MPPKDRMPPPAGGPGRGKGGGKAAGKGSKGKGGEPGDAAKRLADLDGNSIEAESRMEILRSQRAAARRGGVSIRDTVRENEGIDAADPEKAIDDGIRIEPFNMRREMAEGHFDEGGFYVLNKDEEKEVTDAWLDTVDHAEKTGAFKREDEKRKAAQKAASRLGALSKHLKEAGDDGDEKDEEDDAEDVKAKEGEEQAAKAEEPQEEPEEDVVTMLEGLISELMPLETPTEALARLARSAKTAKLRQGKPDELPALKMRSRIRQARAAAAGGQAAKADGGDSAMAAAKSKRRRFNEFGYEEGAGAAQSEPAASSSAKADVLQESGKGDAAAAGATADGADAPKSTVADAAAVAAAAEKAAVKEKADAEAAAAFAAEMRVTRHVLREFAGTEAKEVVNLNADDVCKARAKEEAEEKPEEVKPEEEPEEPLVKRPKKMMEVNDIQKECRQRIERLTDLCDSLLQKGVNVYDSARELLAIEVRERKGEKLTADDAAEDAGEPAVKQGGDDAEAKPPAASSSGAPAEKTPSSLLYDNRRLAAAGGEPAVVDADKFQAGGPADSQLLWQFRWKATPDEIHGPFDSVTMHGWSTQGCFAEERPAEIRQCGADNQPMESCWHSWEKMDFELYL